MENTTNFDLRKPGSGDFYNVEDQNANMDKIDAALSKMPQISDLEDVPVHILEDADSLQGQPKSYFEGLVTDLENETNAALAVKADIYRSFEELGLTEATATIESIVAAMADRTELCTKVGTAGVGTGLVPGTYGLLQVTKWDTNFVKFSFQRPTGQLWVGYFNAADASGPIWSGWLKIATATPPEEYDLPLASELSTYMGRAIYWKDQYNQVHFYLSIKKGGVSNDIINGATIFILPVGYRPGVEDDDAICICTEGLSNATSQAGFITISPDGVAHVYNHTTASCTWIHSSGCFIAKN